MRKYEKGALRAFVKELRALGAHIETCGSTFDFYNQEGRGFPVSLKERTKLDACVFAREIDDWDNEVYWSNVSGSWDKIVKDLSHYCLGYSIN